VNYWTISDQHGDMVAEASYEEPCIFNSDFLCMFADLACDEQKFG